MLYHRVQNNLISQLNVDLVKIILNNVLYLSFSDSLCSTVFHSETALNCVCVDNLLTGKCVTVTAHFNALLEASSDWPFRVCGCKTSKYTCNMYARFQPKLDLVKYAVLGVQHLPLKH